MGPSPNEITFQPSTRRSILSSVVVVKSRGPRGRRRRRISDQVNRQNGRKAQKSKRACFYEMLKSHSIRRSFIEGGCVSQMYRNAVHLIHVSACLSFVDFPRINAKPTCTSMEDPRRIVEPGAILRVRTSPPPCHIEESKEV